MGNETGESKIHCKDTFLKPLLRVCMRAKLLQSCLTLSNLMGCSLPGSSVCGILQTRILEWVAIPFPEDFPDPEILSLALQADSLQSEPPSKKKPLLCTRIW